MTLLAQDSASYEPNLRVDRHTTCFHLASMATTIRVQELTGADFRSLAKLEHSPSLSFFVESSPQRSVPTLKALVQEARARLHGRSVEAGCINEILAPLEVALGELYLPVSAGETFIAFCSKDFFGSFSVPLNIQSRLIIDRRFCLKPILPCLTRHRRYHVLAISENAARLFSCENQTCHEIRTQEFPANLRDVLSSRDFSSSLQAHSSGVPGHHGLTQHGHSGPVEEVHRNRIAYCRYIGAAIEKQLGRTGDPLVLACVNEYVPGFREVNHYAGLVDQVIVGNPDRLSEKQIHTAAQKIVDVVSEKQTQAALAQCAELQGTKHTSDSLAEILRGVLEGRVKEVFVASEVDAWGTFDPSANHLFLAKNGEDWGTQEITNLVAIEACLHGGTAHLIDPTSLPAGKSALAVFRY